MSKITIGCNEISDNICFLQNEFNIVTPNICIKNNQIVKNFDYLLQFDSDNKFSVLNLSTIGCDRFKKSTQMSLLRNYGINTPNYYKSYELGNNAYHQYMMLMEDVNEETDLILKMEFGARGIGQVLLKKKELYDFFESIGEKPDVIEMSKKFTFGGNISKNTKEELESISDSFINNDFTITEKLTLQQEYRLILFYDVYPFVVKRSTTNWQSNISLDNDFELVSLDFIDKNFYKKVKNYFLTLKTPFLSLDVYQDSEGKWGLFEYQMQFGYKALPKSRLINKTVQSTKKLIKHLFKTEKL